MIRIYLFGFSLFFIFVSPTLFVRVPADDGIFNYIDSRMYLPLLGLMLCFSVLIERISPKINRTLLTIVFSAIVIYSMTFAFLHNQVYKNGETYWTAALKNNPDRATYWMGLGYYYLDNKMYPKAELCVLEALKLRPENADYYHKASVIFEANGDLYRSNELLEKALPYEKDKAQALLVITKNYLRLKDKEQAAHFTSEIEKIDMKGKNKAADIFSSLAYFYSYSGYYNEAILQMKKAIQFQPQNSRFINDLGAFFFSSGKIDSAKLYFNKALTLEPTNNEYRHNLLLSEKKSHL